MSFNSKHSGAEVEELLDKMKEYENIDFSAFATMQKVNEAVAQAITTTLNTEV